MILRSALALTLLLALPATAADDQILTYLTGKLDGKAKDHAQAAYAACTLGRGDAEATATLFTDHGWTRDDNGEAGLITLYPQGENPIVTLASDGSFCDVADRTAGTYTATGRLMVLIGSAGFGSDSADSAQNCIALTLEPGLVAEVLSAGNDPVCESETDSAIRFSFTAP